MNGERRFAAIGGWLCFGLSVALGIKLSPFGASVLAIALLHSAYMSEIFRAGIEAVPRTTIEAAESLWFSRWQAYRQIVLPLAFRVSLPALNNNLVNLVKTTTLAYAIAVPEMLYVSSQIWSDELNVPVMMNVLLLCYFLLVGLVVWLMTVWEHKMRVPGVCT